MINFNVLESNMRRISKYFLSFFLFLSAFLSAQCPQFFDGMGNPSSNPYWVSCSGLNYNFNLISTINYTNYTINWGDGSPVTNGASQAGGVALVHNYTAVVDTYVVTITCDPGCMITGVVVMEEPVNASIQIPLGGVTTACAPATLQFINSSTDVSPTTVFTWDFGDGSPIQTFNYTNAGQTISHLYQSGTVNCQTAVTLTAENYCSFGNPTLASFNPIQIYDRDNASITPSAFVKCWPDNIFTFTNNTARNCLAQGNVAQRYLYWNLGNYWGTGSDSIINWTPWPPSTNPTVAYPSVGTYSVMLVDSNACGLDTAFTQVTIVNPPVAGVAAPTNTACVGVSLTFNNTSNTGYIYRWNFGDSPTWTTFPFGNVNHAYSVAGTYTVSVVALVLGGAASCRDTDRVVVTIFPSPIAQFTPSSSIGCDTLTVGYTDNSVAAISYSWNLGNGVFSSSSTPPAQTYTVGTYTVSLSVTSANSCPNSTQQVINVYANPVANFTPFSFCEDAPTPFTDLSTSNPGDPIVGWNWDFGDGSSGATSQNPVHTYTASGVYTATLTVNTANCSNTFTTNVTVNPKPVPSFTLSPTNGCGPLIVSTSNGSSGAASYNWDFGNGTNSTLVNPVVTYTNTNVNDTVFYVQLIATTALGCNDTIIDSVRVFGKPLAAFTHTYTPACSPTAIPFTNTSQSAVSYLWDFGDTTATSVLTNPSHLYNNQSLVLINYTVTLIVSNAAGCKDTATDVIQVYPEPIFGFTMVPDTGCTPLSVNFPSVLGAIAYQWDFGDGNNTTGANPVHVYNNASSTTANYTVTLIATNGFNCKDTTKGVVVVYPKPQADFVPSVSQGCPSLSTNLNNSSIGATSFIWDFDDGTPTTTATSPLHIFQNTSTSISDTFFVSMIATSNFGCADTIIKPIIVYPAVDAYFYPDTPICAPTLVVMHNQSQGANSYNWNFGDGNSSTLSNPSHGYVNAGPAPLQYTISLTATSAFGCVDTYNKPYTIYPTPISTFNASPLSQTFPNTNVVLTNTSPNAASYTNIWDYGDGTTNGAVQPGNYTYATWGTYTMVLVLTNGFCSDTSTQIINIMPPAPIPDFRGSKAGCRPVTVSFTNLTQYGTTYNWSFGDGGSSSQTNPTYTYYNPGTYTVTLSATGPGGTNNIIGIDSVIVYPVPIAAFTANPTTVGAINDPVNCTNLTAGGASYQWDFGDGTPTDFSIDPVHFYQTAGEYQITLIALNGYGCRDTFALGSKIIVEENTEIEVPNAFTPNSGGSSGGEFDPNDTSNDIFHPVVKGVSKYELSIYNRWGELIFESKDTKIGWDGYYRGKLCPSDVYVWKIKATDNGGKTINKSGDLLLLR